MYEKISVTDLNREEWLKLRKTGIGGSDAGAICSLNPYAGAMSVYRDKTSEELRTEDNEAMRQGRDLEEYVALRFTEETGLKVRCSNVMYRNREHPFMIADVDRLIVGRDAGLECKTASAYNADKWNNDEVPAHYLIQCYHYMAVTGKREWYIAVVILGREFKYAKITWEEELIQNLIAIESEFWNRHVIPKILPEPDGSSACDEVLEQYFGNTRKGSAIPLLGFDGQLNRRRELSELICKLEQEQRQIDQEIKLYMQDHEAAFNDQYRITWLDVETARLDTKRIKAEKPEIYREFLNVTRSRRFTVKAA